MSPFAAAFTPSIRHVLQGFIQRRQSLAEAERKAAPEHLASILQTLLQQADTASAALPILVEQKRPATTAVLCVLSVHQGLTYATLAHIGDSRVYLLREGQPLQCLTKDHGYFPFTVRQQRLTSGDALRIEQREHWRRCAREAF